MRAAEHYGINLAGYVIHSAIHRARRDVNAVIHPHSTTGMAVSARTSGLLPLTQNAMRFDGHIGYHDHVGLAVDGGLLASLSAAGELQD